MLLRLLNSSAAVRAPGRAEISLGHFETLDDQGPSWTMEHCVNIRIWRVVPLGDGAGGSYLCRWRSNLMCYFLIIEYVLQF